MIIKRIIISVLVLAGFFAADWAVSALINHGLDRYFGLDQQPEVLLLGHSELMLAVDKTAFEDSIGLKVSKYCREGVNATDRLAMARQFLDSELGDSLQYVLYGVDPFMFNGTGLSANSYKLFYPFMDDAKIDEYVRESTDGTDYWLHRLIRTNRYSDPLLNSAMRGWRDDWSNYKFGNVDIEALKDDVKNGRQRHITFEKSLMHDFEETVRLLTERGIYVVLVGAPLVDVLNEYEPDKYREIQEYYEGVAESSPLVSYWDLNPQFSHRHDLFFDPLHLNDKGQKEVNRELTRRFNELNSKK